MTQSATEPCHPTKGNLALIRRELPSQAIRSCTTDFEQAKALGPPLSVLCGLGSVVSVTPAEGLVFYLATH